MTPTDETPMGAHTTIVDSQGKPARLPADRACPACGSMRRRLSGGFGPVHDICADCGHDFPGEKTAEQ